MKWLTGIFVLFLAGVSAAANRGRGLYGTIQQFEKNCGNN